MPGCVAASDAFCSESRPRGSPLNAEHRRRGHLASYRSIAFPPASPSPQPNLERHTIVVQKWEQSELMYMLGSMTNRLPSILRAYTSFFLVVSFFAERTMAVPDVLAAGTGVCCRLPCLLKWRAELLRRSSHISTVQCSQLSFDHLQPLQHHLAIRWHLLSHLVDDNKQQRCLSDHDTVSNAQHRRYKYRPRDTNWRK